MARRERPGYCSHTLTDGPDQAARLAALEALLGVTSALSGAVTPEHVGAAVAEHGARALGSTGGIVYALDGGDTLRVIGRASCRERV